MKVRLAPSAAMTDAPYWQDTLSNHDRVVDSIHPAIDALLDRHGTPVQVTREYSPAGEAWSREEVDCALDRVYRLILRKNTRIPPDLIADISILPAVEYVEIGRVGRAEVPQIRAAAFSRTTGQGSRDAILLSDAHMISQGHEEVTVAVLDTGVSLTHHEYASVIKKRADFVHIIDGEADFVGDFLEVDFDPSDEVGHGTHVAGIICASGQNMPVGVAPGCSLMPVRVLGAMRKGDQVIGAGLIDNINVAVKWAVDEGADVINMSLGVPHEGGGLPHEEVVAYAKAKGVTIVAASGNDGQNARYYPATLPHVITVGAFGQSGEVAAFSTWGEHVDVVAPGTDIYSTYLEDKYAFSSGTSHAAPFVTGAIALLKSYARERGHELQDHQIKHVLKHTSDKLDGRFRHEKAGFGRLNVRDALRMTEHKLRVPTGFRG